MQCECARNPIREGRKGPAVRIQTVALMAGLDPDGMPSMAQGRVNGKRTEVEEFAGTICELGRAHGILTPTNDWRYERVRQIESGF